MGLYLTRLSLRIVDQDTSFNKILEYYVKVHLGLSNIIETIVKSECPESNF